MFLSELPRKLWGLLRGEQRVLSNNIYDITEFF